MKILFYWGNREDDEQHDERLLPSLINQFTRVRTLDNGWDVDGQCDGSCHRELTSNVWHIVLLSNGFGLETDVQWRWNDRGHRIYVLKCWYVWTYVFNFYIKINGLSLILSFYSCLWRCQMYSMYDLCLFNVKTSWL